MDETKLKGKALKQHVGRLLRREDLPAALEQLCHIPPRRVVNPLFSFLCHHDPVTRWHAVTAMGRVVSDQASSDMPAARVIMRRLMWHLNDESGGIGWGCPEAMGEVMACSPSLAREYGDILISYINPRGNYLEHETLQQGVLWGLGRFLHAVPRQDDDCAGHLVPFLKLPDPVRRGLAARAIGPIAGNKVRKPLEALIGDTSDLAIYMNGTFVTCTVGDLAFQSLGFR